MDEDFGLLVHLDQAYDIKGQLIYEKIPVGVSLAQLLQGMSKDPPACYLWSCFNHRTLTFNIGKRGYYNGPGV